MVALYQFLKPRFDLLRGRVDVQAHCVEGLTLGIADRTSFSARALFRTQSLAKQPKRVGVASERAHIRPHVSLAGAHFPCRTMTRKGVFLVRHHRGVAHASKEIIRLVVRPGVIETEAPIFVLASTALRRPMRRFFLAAVPFASRAASPWAAIFFWFDADPVKKGGVEFHDRTLCAFASD